MNLRAHTFEARLQVIDKLKGASVKLLSAKEVYGAL